MDGCCLHFKACTLSGPTIHGAIGEDIAFWAPLICPPPSSVGVAEGGIGLREIFLCLLPLAAPSGGRLEDIFLLGPPLTTIGMPGDF